MLRMVKRLDLKILAIVVLYSLLIFIDISYREYEPETIERDLTIQNEPQQHSNLTGEIVWPEYDDSYKCPRHPNTLLGNILLFVANSSISGNARKIFHRRAFKRDKIGYGGWWKPRNCTARVKVAILVPFRKRPEQLKVFLKHMHPVFQRQLLSYRIFVIEQAGNHSFNKGAIYNIGFDRTLGFDDYDCYIFHDVDLLSENDFNYYGCPMSPLHMSVAIDKFKYKLPYKNIFGGIQAFKVEHYKLVNGYSNKFWGWGAEDDDLLKRSIAFGLKLNRPSLDVGRYTMNQDHHYRSDQWSQANHRLLFKRRTKQKIDGLNSIHTLNYTIRVKEKPFYTLVSINLVRS